MNATVAFHNVKAPKIRNEWRNGPRCGIPDDSYRSQNLKICSDIMTPSESNMIVYRLIRGSCASTRINNTDKQYIVSRAI